MHTGIFYVRVQEGALDGIAEQCGGEFKKDRIKNYLNEKGPLPVLAISEDTLLQKAKVPVLEGAGTGFKTEDIPIPITILLVPIFTRLVWIPAQLADYIGIDLESS